MSVVNSVLVSRRTVLLVAAAGTGVVLSGCGVLKKGGSASSGKSSGAVSPRAVATATGPHGGVMLDSGLEGKAVSVEVGPAVVVDDHTVVRLVMSNPGDGYYYVSSAFGTMGSPLSLLDIKMFSLGKGLVFPQLSVAGSDFLVEVRKDRPLELFPVFASLGDGINTVELLLPHLGMVVGVPVVDEAHSGFSVADVLAKTELVKKAPGPFRLQSHTLSADGASDTKQDEKSTTVTVAGDVTFATDSDQLSGQADSVLATVVEQIKKFPSGGDLTITGYTDDVADDAHNQELSERRAKAVSERLKKLTELSAWKESVSGKGESSPRVANDTDEHRQANRRVEITLTPSKPAEASAPPSASAAPSSTAMPKAAGPVGKGPEGVDVIVDGKRLHMTMERMVRIGRYLTGSLELSSQQEMDLQMSSFALPSTMQTLSDWVMGGVYSLTLLSGGTRYMEADFESADWGRLPAAMTALTGSVHPGEPLRLPVVWPDIGGSSAVIDIPGGEARGPGRVVARLTDIPIINA